MARVILHFMKCVLVIGCPGSGKSTFSRKLSAKTGLPLHYLDMIWHKPDKTNISRDKFDEKLEEILQTDKWIIDGNYLRTMPRRLQECDTVFFFDLPLDDCMSGVRDRIGKPREDMPWIETEFDEEFRKWILDFPAMQTPQINELLESFNGNIVRFKSRKEADSYIDSL